MPFSSSPVLVGRNDQIQVRYPTPDFWNEQVTVQIKIGNGQDPDGITFGTKIPDATPDSFTFTNQSGFTGAFNGTSSSGSTSTFQRNTTYYSQVIDITGIEVPIPATISAVSSGPKNNNTANTTAAFRIYRNGSFLTGWITSRTANYVTPGDSGLQPGDKIQLRVTTPDWYTTATTVTFTVSDETWGTNIGQPAASFSRTWSITTRAQDQNIPQYSFTDQVDVKTVADGGPDYHYQDITINNIDGDAVLRATSTGNLQVRKNGSGSWSTSVTNLVLNDTLNTRLLSGPGYTTKTTGALDVFAVGGDTYTSGGNSYENNISGTWGSSTYAVTQSLGTITDNWQAWTEVDRYPNAISASPIFTYGVQPTVTVASGGFSANTNYSPTGGSGSGMVVKTVGNNTTFGFGVVVVDPGYGYQIGDTLSVASPVSGIPPAQFVLSEYQKINVSTTSTNAVAEPGFMYFADFNVSGLGTEYSSGSYNDLESPISGLVNTVAVAQSRVNTLNGSTVQMTAIIDGTGGFIRKNNSGTWVQQLTVQNGDVINLKVASSTTYGASVNASVRLKGPPDGNPTTGNPTGGPSTATFADKTTTLSLTTRAERSTPYPFHAEAVYLSDPGEQHVAQVYFSGLDVATTAVIQSGSGSLSRDGVNWGNNITVQPTDQFIYVRQNASSSSGGLAQLTYRIGTYSDTFRIYTIQSNVQGEFITYSQTGDAQNNFVEYTLPDFAGYLFYLTLVGAGGGKGGDDAPNSYGGPGGAGNTLRVQVQIPDSAWPLDGGGSPDRKLRIYAPDHGNDGSNFVQGSGGGLGGFGYCYGGDGGNAGPSDKSGGGGGGGGAAAITFSNNVLIAMAGGGGGGAGAGNDTTIPAANSYGNYGSNYGTLQTSTVNLNLPGDDGPNATGEGGGAGGGGGGYDGNAGVLLTQKLDASGGVIQTSDLDATGGTGGGSYYNATYCTLVSAAAVSGDGAAPGEAGAVYIEFPQQDITPDPFSFPDYEGADIGETVLSNIVQITGITGPVPVTVNAPGFSADMRLCSGSTAATCGSFNSSISITNGQYLQIRAIVGNQYNNTYTVTVSIGTVTNQWNINTGPPPDDEPAPYFFRDVDNANINTDTLSETVTISGINVPVVVTATDGAYVSINGGSFVDGDTSPESQRTITNGQTLQIRLTSSPDFLSSVSTSITVGTGDTAVWTVTTAEEKDSVPIGFTWIYKLGADLLTTYESNTIIMKGIEVPVDFIVESGSGDGNPSGPLPRIKVNDVLQPVGVTQVTINNFDTVALVYTTSNVIGETRIFNTKTGLATSTVGYYETEWGVVTAGQFGTTPTAFAFLTTLATAPNVYTEAKDSGGNVQVVTISGLSTGISIALFGNNNIEFNINNGGYNIYTLASPANVSNGDTFKVRLRSSAIQGFTRSAQVYAGSFSTTFNVQTPAAVQDPIFGQWYSAIQPVKYVGSQQVRYSTKYDGLPVASMIPVFQDETQEDGWGNLDGSLASRFHGWLYCDGGYYDPADYPALYEVIGTSYGSKSVGGVVYFRLPDMRNRYLKGTGVIDGNSLASPGLTPEYNRTKQSGAPGNEEPGSFGGMWFIDTIADPGAELEQVETPATGQPAQESQFFGIAQVTTTGYTDVTGLIEFQTYGSIDVPLSLEGDKQYDIPLHFHDLVTGVADPGNFKGRINWNGRGGAGADIAATTNNIIGTNSAQFTADTSFSINLWGYAVANYTLDSSNLPDSLYCGGTPVWWNGNVSFYNGNAFMSGAGYEGAVIASTGQYANVTVTQSSITVGSSNYNEINTYIDLDTKPFSGTSGAVGSDNALKFVGALDIPRKDVTVKSYNPPSKLKHTHYLSLTAITDTNTVYGYGNNETGGTASAGLQSFVGGINTTVDLNFSALDIGIQVLPGSFTLSETKQLIPTPEFAPQEKVPLLTPYVWTKWLIKAF
jgi:hypothetical protein